MRMRPAFTIIEVIFMMSVLAVVLPTLPLLIFKSAHAVKELQHTQYYANGYTNTMLTVNKLWDEQNANDLAMSGKYYVLNSDAVSNQNANLDCVNNYRAGHYQAKNRRKCSTTGGLVSAIGLDGEAIDAFNLNDIDDFDGTQYRIIPTNRLTPAFEAEINAVLPAGENTWEWLQKILSEPFDELNPAPSLAAISAKYGITIPQAQRWVQNLPTVQIATTVEFIDYIKPNFNTIATGTITPLVGATTDIKRVTVTITDLTDKNLDTRKEITYYYYATNIGTDIPLVKVNN